MQAKKIGPIARDNISDAVVASVRDMIVDGRLAPGTRLNEVHLAQALGVSRTPLREALNRLGQEGALISTPRIGYSVRPLMLEEFEQVYDLRPLLDPEALRLAGLPPPDRLARLRVLQHRLENARNAAEAIEVDDDWHFTLIEACPNKVLLEMIVQLARRTRRYEIALMRERRNVLKAGLGHRAIMAAIKRGDLSGACNALKRNLEAGKAPIAAWLRERVPA